MPCELSHGESKVEKVEIFAYWRRLVLHMFDVSDD